MFPIRRDRNLLHVLCFRTKARPLGRIHRPQRKCITEQIYRTDGPTEHFYGLPRKTRACPHSKQIRSQTGQSVTYCCFDYNHIVLHNFALVTRNKLFARWVGFGVIVLTQSHDSVKRNRCVSCCRFAFKWTDDGSKAGVSQSTGYEYTGTAPTC